MKLLMALILACSTTLAFAKQGEVTLKKKKLIVAVTSKSIVVGTEEFSITDKSNGKLEGKLKVVVNGKVKADKNVMLVTDEKTLSEVVNEVELLGLQNEKEVKCTSESNAFILIGDNLNAPYPMIGNCLTLR